MNASDPRTWRPRCARCGTLVLTDVQVSPLRQCLDFTFQCHGHIETVSLTRLELEAATHITIGLCFVA